MAHAPLTHTRLAAAGAIVLIGLALSCLSVGGFGSPPPVRHDDWRRTAHGWERSTAWQIPAVPRLNANQSQKPKNTANQTRFDTHPAALALLQLVGALTALAYFTPTAAVKSTRGPHWKTALSRSFRA